MENEKTTETETLEQVWQHFVEVQEQKVAAEAEKQRALADPTVRDAVERVDMLDAQIIALEEDVKRLMKENKVMNLQSDRFEAVMQIRHAKPTLQYDIPAIEKEPWGPACVEKTVNDKMFKMICEGKSLDMNLYCKSTPGAETQAVAIHRIDLDPQKVE